MIEKLLNHLRSIAGDSAEVGILQPADPFLETAGEDLRRRIFLTESATGALKCLRPEFTIPICLHHIDETRTKARYAYGGTVFRQERAGDVEFAQVGLEDLGDTAHVEADAACLADMVQTLTMAGTSRFTVTLGDRRLFASLIKSFELPEAIGQRLMRNFGERDDLQSLIANLVAVGSSAELDATFAGLLDDEPALIAHVEIQMELAGISPNSGRSPADIAYRMIEKTKEASFVLDRAKADTLNRFLKIECPLEQASDALATFAKSEEINLGDALTNFDQRVAAIKSRGVALDNINYNASFGRKLEYYTGVLFEAHSAGHSDAIAGGGRYDRLCSLLGATTPIPAVGFSIMLDRLSVDGGAT